MSPSVRWQYSIPARVRPRRLVNRRSARLTSVCAAARSAGPIAAAEIHDRPGAVMHRSAAGVHVVGEQVGDHLACLLPRAWTVAGRLASAALPAPRNPRPFASVAGRAAQNPCRSPARPAPSGRRTSSRTTRARSPRDSAAFLRCSFITRPIRLLSSAAASRRLLPNRPWPIRRLAIATTGLFPGPVKSTNCRCAQSSPPETDLGHGVQSGRDVHCHLILGRRFTLARLTVFALAVPTWPCRGGRARLLQKALAGGKDLGCAASRRRLQAGDGRGAGRPERATQVISYFKSMASASSATSSGSTASTISCTGMVRVVVPCMSELELIGTLRVRTGVTTTPSCTNGLTRLRLGSKGHIGSRHDAGSQPPGAGTARPRHVHGDAGQQIHVVALFQVMDALELAGVQGDRAFSFRRAAHHARAGCPRAENRLP